MLTYEWALAGLLVAALAGLNYWYWFVLAPKDRERTEDDKLDMLL